MIQEFLRLFFIQAPLLKVGYVLLCEFLYITGNTNSCRVAFSYMLLKSAGKEGKVGSEVPSERHEKFISKLNRWRKRMMKDN